MTSTAAKRFMFVNCNPLDGIQKPNQEESKLARSHVVREAYRQARAMRLAALKAPNVSTGISKLSSFKAGTQSTISE
jgi:hypothetical protein